MCSIFMTLTDIFECANVVEADFPAHKNVLYGALLQTQGYKPFYIKHKAEIVYLVD